MLLRCVMGLKNCNGVQKELGQAASDTVDVAKSIERASRTVAETAEQLSALIGRFKTQADDRQATQVVTKKGNSPHS